jgi:fructosamine-3-kinase
LFKSDLKFGTVCATYNLAFNQCNKIEHEENFMSEKLTLEQQDESNTIKDPDNWTTGDEPMTGAQRSYLTTLSEEAKEEFDENLTKAEASKRIEELQQKIGRGADS